MIRYLSPLLLACMLNAPIAAAEESPAGFKGGHAKYQFLLNTFPEDSLFRDYPGTPAIDQNADLRLKFGWQKNNVSLVTDYQLIVQHGDSIRLANSLPGPVAPVIITNPTPDDDNRLFDLTRVISQSDDTVLSHRLDRLYADITSSNIAARIGRQAVSWGNGLIYTPMDFFNPFDPAAVDKEYKTGDDMLYAQYLQQSGNDLQAAWVVRRDNNGDVSSDADSIAAKYHGFIGNNEFDLLLAEHYDDNILGIGGIANIGGAVWRGDITLTRTSSGPAQSGNVASLVTSLSYSWTGWGHNVSGILEYFYNGFGQGNGDYSWSALAGNPELTERIARGELYTLGRHYIAASAMIEMTPLWLLTPNIFYNASDSSILLQLLTSYDIKQNWQFLAALGLPAGSPGTEYGGIDTAIPGKQLSSGINMFAQLGWYF